MSDTTHSRTPAWDVLNLQLKNHTVPDAAVIRAAYEEHRRQEQAALSEQIHACMDLRDTWIENAEMLLPSSTQSLENKLDDALDNHAASSPQPLLPRFPWVSRLPLLRRFIR